MCDESHHRHIVLSLFLCSPQAVNGPLQERTRVLRADLLEFQGNEDQNLRSQEQLASRISEQMTEVFSLVTKALKIHLNLDKSFKLNSSAVFFTLETVKMESLVGKEIRSVGDARLRLPFRSLDGNDTRHYSLRVRPSISTARESDDCSV